MSMSMNNRLLQNYLDLSVNSEAKISECIPSPGGNMSSKMLKTQKSALTSANSLESQRIEINNNKNVSSTDDYAYSDKNISEIILNNLRFNNSDKISDRVESVELSTFEQTFNLKIPSQKSNENNLTSSNNDLIEGFNSVSGLIVGFESNRIETEQVNNCADSNSIYEINRIPSIRKQKYSISTVATQADMDKGSIIAERKDYKYRNQEMSDVESQVLSIEVDLCSDAYASIADWRALNNCINNSNKINNLGATAISTYGNNSSSELVLTSNQDRFLSARKELASVTVNDYVAFKNSLNLQLQTAIGTTTSVNTKNDGESIKNNYTIELINTKEKTLLI